MSVYPGWILKKVETLLRSLPQELVDTSPKTQGEGHMGPCAGGEPGASGAVGTGPLPFPRWALSICKWQLRDSLLDKDRAHRHSQHVDIWCHVDKLAR